MKTYKLEHLKSKKQLQITAESFDDAVKHTFDGCMANWICKFVEEKHDNIHECPPKTNTAEDDLKEWKDFLNQLAHDMASPMSSLEQYIYEISKPKEEFRDEEIELGEMAKRSYKKIRGLLDHLRNYARAEEIKIGYSDFAAAIKSSISEMKSRASKNGIEITYVGPKHLIGRFDEKMVERILANLCVNAVEAMGEGGGKITISLLHNDKEVWIDVADTGKGIPEDLIDRVFERGCTYGKKKGTGLGLAFCKKIVEAHGGSIGVYSRDGNGAVFTLAFPLSAAFKTERVEDGGISRLETILFCDADKCDKRVCDFYGEQLAGVSSVKEARANKPSNNQSEFTLDPL